MVWWKTSTYPYKKINIIRQEMKGTKTSKFFRFSIFWFFLQNIDLSLLVPFLTYNLRMFDLYNGRKLSFLNVNKHAVLLLKGLKRNVVFVYIFYFWYFKLNFKYLTLFIHGVLTVTFSAVSRVLFTFAYMPFRKFCYVIKI